MTATADPIHQETASEIQRPRYEEGESYVQEVPNSIITGSGAGNASIQAAHADEVGEEPSSLSFKSWPSESTRPSVERIDASTTNDTPSARSLPPSLAGYSPPTSRRISVVKDDFDPSHHDALYGSMPAQLRSGTIMLKVSAKKVQRRMVRLKAEAGQVLWESKHAGMRAQHISPHTLLDF